MHTHLVAHVADEVERPLVALGADLGIGARFNEQLDGGGAAVTRSHMQW